MKKHVVTAITIPLILLVSAMAFLSCAPASTTTAEKQTVEIKRGELQVAVTADGNLIMPKEAKLQFETPGTVLSVPAEAIRTDTTLKGRVKAGTLLAKLDNSLQKLAVSSALYDVELALNELAERVFPSLLGYPHYYPTTGVTLRVAQAESELGQARILLEQAQQSNAAIKIRTARYDLEASLDTLKATITDTKTYPAIVATYSQPADEYPGEPAPPNIKDAIEMIEQDLVILTSVQDSLENGATARALSVLKLAQQHITQTKSIAEKVCGKVMMLGISYPDASTSLDSLRAAQANLLAIQDKIKEGNYDSAELAKVLTMTQHDLEMSNTILTNNELIFKHGVNLKVLRQNNLSLQKYELALQKAKEELLKTEILAPFDGTIVDVGVKEHMVLSAYNYSSITAVQLVDTKYVELEGVVDEIDIFKVKVGQEAIITVDALPDQQLKGKVIFISPFGTEKTGVVNYKVTMKLDSTDIELKGGLTATADIIIESKKDILLIPNGAVKGTGGNYWTQVVKDEKKGDIEKRQITLGIQDRRYSEVISGLSEGEKVIDEKPQTTTRSALTQ
jgi:RND family efflux transporter MFP subunit